MPFISAASGARAYTIGDLADLFGISRRTLRFYEERELIRPRRAGSHRIYSQDDRMRLEIIVRAKRLGFSLSVIWELLDRQNKTPASDATPACHNTLVLSEDEIRAQVERLTSERERVDRAIEELRAAAARDSFGLEGSETNPGRTTG